MYLLDTNVLSELRKYQNNKIDENVKRWFASIQPQQTFISVITISEIYRGILSLQRKDKRQALMINQWFEDFVLPEYQERILAIDKKTALINAELHVPNKMPIDDAYICATAIVNDLILVTRNVKDFQCDTLERYNLTLLNPFKF